MFLLTLESTKFCRHAGVSDFSLGVGNKGNGNSLFEEVTKIALQDYS